MNPYVTSVLKLSSAHQAVVAMYGRTSVLILDVKINVMMKPSLSCNEYEFTMKYVSLLLPRNRQTVTVELNNVFIGKSKAHCHRHVVAVFIGNSYSLQESEGLTTTLP